MTDWLIRPAPRAQPACRLVCLPHAGAGPSAFVDWPELLAPGIELCAVELPGHGARIAEPALRDARALAAALYTALVPLLDVPVAAFGHSMGALIAFELAREARRRGGPELRWLFASAYPAPQLPYTGAQLHAAPDAEFLAGLAAWYPTEDPAERALLGELLPVLRADFELCERYAYTTEPPLELPISAFGGLSDPEVPRAAIAAWQSQTTGPFQARMVPGDHLFYRGAAPRLLRVIDKELASLAA
jgi:medium-chain acyl-[acyl-carrier-protein] hydrolase